MGAEPSPDVGFEDEQAVPYFLWDRNVTVGELRAVLASESDPRRMPLLRTLLREARPDEVWNFVTPGLVAREWDLIAQGLGRRRAFWEWLLSAWRANGYIE
jgi:hypothetical protein